MRKLKVLIYILLPILLIAAGWTVFNRVIRPNHYQLLYPYSIFQFRSDSVTDTRMGDDKRLQIFIPEGTANLGKDDYVENLFVEDFWIDQIPVTVSAYKEFLNQTGLLEPRYRDEYRMYWDEKQYELLPVVFVSWGQAESYCEYYGGHLPTEAQWEKATRGPQGVTLYWDDSEKAYNMANYDNFYNGTTPAGWLPAGKSVYGVMEISGNVREWVIDWFTDFSTPIHTESWDVLRDENPTNPEVVRILKGGSFVDDVSHLRLSSRDFHDPNSPGLNRGFRCVYEN